MSKTYFVVNADDMTIASNATRFRSRKAAMESAARVNAIRAAVGLRASLTVLQGA